MPIIPCPNVPSGSDCECIENSPYRNISAEAPDLPVFLGVAFDTETPPLGTMWDAVGCMSTCESTVSQQAADLCAQEQALECAVSSWQNPNPSICHIDPVLCQPVPPPSRQPQIGLPFLLFFNAPQTGQALCPDGLPFFFSVPAGVFAAFNQASADEKALTYANRQAQLRQICLSIDNTLNCVGEPFMATITATGADLATGMQTNNWVLEAGLLPPGLTFNGGELSSNTATITGTANQAGAYLFFIGVTDPQGNFMSKGFTINIAGITNVALIPGGTVGTPYSFTLDTNTTDVFLGVVGGALPPGLGLDAAGDIIGTPTTQGTFTALLQMKDPASGLICQQSITIGVNSTAFPWNLLVWDIPPDADTNFGTNATGSINTSGAVMMGSSFCPQGLTNGDRYTGFNTGHLTYTGPTYNGNVKVQVFSQASATPPGGNIINIQVNGSAVFNVDVESLAVGTYHFNFTIPGGVNQAIQVQVQFFCGNSDNVGMTWTGTLM